MPRASTITLAEFFEGRPEAALLFDAVQHVVGGEPQVKVRVTKSQVAFSRRRGFAWVWTPDRYLRGKTAPLVLSIALSRRDVSPRWKEVVQPAPGRWMHHLELRSADEVDADVVTWLHEAAASAG